MKLSITETRGGDRLSDIDVDENSKPTEAWLDQVEALLTPDVTDEPDPEADVNDG